MCFKQTLSEHRLGPSASQIHINVDEDKIAQLVQAVSYIQSAMKEPWAQSVLGVVAGSAGSEMQAAEAGNPAPSRPMPSPPALPQGLVPPKSELATVLYPPATLPKQEMPAPATVPKQEMAQPVQASSAAAPSETTAAATPVTTPAAQAAVPAVATAVTPTVAPPEQAAPDPPVEMTINSSTHRQAHARLSRRMAGLSEGECPNMSKLWNGTRKDQTLSKIKGL